MTKSKIETVLQVAGVIQNTMTIIANRVAARGGNLTEALVRLGKGEARYENSLNLIAGELAGISGKTLEIAAPEGGRMHVVRVLVNESMGWGAAISAGFPATPSDNDVRKVGVCYPRRPSVKWAEREIILIKFGEGILRDVALEWGRKHKLTPVSPRSVWALGEYKPQLNIDLEQPFLVVGALEDCTFFNECRTPYGWWDGAMRSAGLSDLGNEAWAVHCWFAFERDPSA